MRNDSGIYSLIDPRTNELRYIGLSKHISYRYKQHCNPKSTTKGTHLLNWTNQLFEQNLKPELYILELCEEKDLKENEQFWIAYFKGLGCKLVNISAGGEDFNCASSTRKKISETLKGHEVTQETREKIRIASINQIREPMSAEQKIKLSIAHKGKIKSEEHRKNIRLSIIGRRNPKKPGRHIKDEFGNVFISLTKASEFHQIPIHKIWRILNNKIKSPTI